jgi:hypothetical protein
VSEPPAQVAAARVAHSEQMTIVHCMDDWSPRVGPWVGSLNVCPLLLHALVRSLSVPGAGVHWYGKAEAKKGESTSIFLEYKLLGFTDASSLGEARRLCTALIMCGCLLSRPQDGPHHVRGAEPAGAQAARGAVRAPD